MTEPKVDWTSRPGVDCELIGRRAVYTNYTWTFYDVLRQTYTNSAGSRPFREFFPTLAVAEFFETPEQIKSEIKISSRLSRPAKSADMPLSKTLPTTLTPPKKP